MTEESTPRSVSEQLRDVAAYLLEIAESEQTLEHSTPRPAIPLRQSRQVDDLLLLAQFAKEELDERLKRNEFFDPDLFGEPAWDLLLDLFVSRVHGKKISITSACIGSGVPPTTALRWIEVLGSRGLLSRSSDEFDQRRKFVSLTDDAFWSLARYLRRRFNERKPAIISFRYPSLASR